MTTFVVVSTHTADQCPVANAKIRELTTADPTATQTLAQKLGIKMIAGPLVSAEHRGFAVVEAPKIETVREFVLQSGLLLWNSVEIIHVLTMEEGMKELAAVKPIY